MPYLRHPYDLLGLFVEINACHSCILLHIEYYKSCYRVWHLTVFWRLTNLKEEFEYAINE